MLETEESTPELKPHPPRFNKLTRNISDSVSESYVKSLRKYADYIYEINYSKESNLQKVDSSFSSNSKLYSITFPPSLTTIEPESLSGFRYLYEVLFLKNDDGENFLETIGYYAFLYTCLESINIPSNIVNIESRCFPKYLKSIEFEKGAPKLQKLGDFAFSKTQIETFKMPINISPLLNSKNPFSQCQKLNKIIFDSYIDKEDPPTIDYEAEESEKENIKNQKEKLKEKGQKLIVSDKIDTLLNFENEEEEDSLVNLPTLDLAKHFTLSQIPNLESIEVFTTNLNNFYFFNTPNLTSIEIPESDKGRYIKHEGCLYTKDKKSLIVAERNIKSATILADCQLISNYALNVKSLEKVTFEKNSELQEISMFAFAESNIKELNIPDSVDLINVGAFYKCENLETVNVPISLTSINVATFSYSKLTKIKIPSSILVIEIGSFYKCSQLSEVEFENDSKLTQIGDYAFSETKIETITIPKSVKSIGNYCFINCKNLKNVIFDDQSNLECIGNECFKGTKIEEIQLPKHVLDFEFDFIGTEVKTVTFSNDSLIENMMNFHHSTITSICIPSSVKTIKKDAFLDCINLEKVTFTNVSESKLTKIQKSAFFNCSSLTEFEMPKSVNYFDINCFKNCEKLVFQVVVEGNCICVCQNAFENSGITAFQSKGKNISVHDLAFNNCPNLTQFSAEATESCILGSSLFTNCTSLTDVKLNSKAKTVKIGQFCFMSSAIKSFDVPKHLKIIPKSCFQNCQNLSQVTVNKGLEVEEFCCEAFAGSGIESIIIPAKTAVIEEKCFMNCLNLKKLGFSKELQDCSIKEKAFYNTGIEQLTISKGVTYIGESSFKNCSNLSKLSFVSESKIKRIKNHAFQSSGINKLVLPSSVNYIEKSAFRDCKQLQSVTFNNKKVHVSSFAFTGCESLKTIKCNNEIIVEALNTPGVFYESPIFVNLTQKLIDETIIKLFLVNSEPLYSHFQRFNIGSALLFKIESRLNLPINCFLNKQNKYKEGDFYYDKFKYQIIEYKEGGFYSNLMKNLLFCDFSRKEIIVPKDTEIIESGAFKYSNLKRIEFEENSLLNEIKCFAFEFLKIEEIEIPDSVTIIGDSAFSDCYSLKKVIINETSNLTTIGQYAFSKTAIKTILFPPSLRTVSDFAFYECYNLVQVENYSNEIKFCHASFFRSSIEKINFPEKSVFEDLSFSSCKELKTISFVDNKEKVVFGEDSFSLSGLEEIVIKCDAVIESKAFAFCYNLKKLTLDGNIECSSDSFACSNLEDCTINLKSSCIHFDLDDIKTTNIERCSIKFDNYELDLKHKCYVVNKILEYADLIDNFSLETPYHCDTNRRPIKKNEILRVPNSVTKLNLQMMSHIKMIIFPSNCLVEDLGPAHSFSYHNLVEITIPKLVQVIPDHCFEHCHFLRTLKFEEGSILKEIGVFSFSNTRIRKALLPSSVQIIKKSAFSNNLDLKEVSFDGEIIEDEAFSMTGIQSFTLSNKTKKIGSKAFQYCYKLRAFSIDIENSMLSEIGSYAFLRTAIASINIPQNVKIIESFTFEDCQFLNELNVSLNSKLEKVKRFAFSGNTRLTKMTIPRSISSLFNKFIGTPNLRSILYQTNKKYCQIENKENPEKLSLVYNFSEENTHNSLTDNSYVVDNELIYADLVDNAGLFEPSTQKELDELMKRNEILIVPINTKKLNFPPMTHVKRILWSSANIVNDIGPSGFFSYYNLIQITIPKSVQIIPPRTFEHCHYLTALLFESKSKLKEIGEYSFSNTKIKTVALPSSVKIIKKGAFSNNPELNEVSFYGEIIEDEAFSRTGITSFILSNKTKSIGSRAFEYCKSLQTFSINLDYSSLSEIGSYAFSESSITSINIPPNVRTIKSFTFSGCRLLKSVNVSNESILEEIEDYSFAENLQLTLINIPKSIKKLSYEAFINTPSLQAIMNGSNEIFNVLDDGSVYGSDRTLIFVPRFLKKFKVIENCLIIHSGAFCGPNLEEVNFADNSLMCIEKCAFAHSTGLKMLTIPKSIQYIGEEAFIECEKLEFVQFDQESQILEIPKFCFAFSGLKAIILPSSIEFINQSAFYFCRRLFSIPLENTHVMYIGDYAFSVTNLEEVKLPSSIKFIGSHAFEAIKSLKEIDLTNISDVDETNNPNQTKEFNRLLFKSQKKILMLIYDKIQHHTLTENEINEKNESIRNELPRQLKIYPNPNPIPPNEDENQPKKSPRRKAKFNEPKIEIKSSPYLMLKNVPKVFKPNPYINKKVSKIHPPFDNRAPIAGPKYGKKNAAFPAPPPPPQQKKEGNSPRRLKRNINNDNDDNNKQLNEYQNIPPQEAYEDEYSQDFTEDSISNEKQINGPKSPKCYIHSTAFCNSTVKTIRCNFDKVQLFNFCEYCTKISKFIVNPNIRFRLHKVGYENNDNSLLPKSLFRITKLQYSNQETIPLLSNHLLSDFFVSKSVKFLNPYTFSYCNKITKVSFDNEIQIKTIPQFCFAYSSLKEISIPSSVQSINKFAFLSCTSLEKINFTRGNNLRFIRKGAFYECSNLSSIHISKSVEKIGKFAFYSCSNLQKVSFSDGSKLRLIDEAAFSKCKNLSSIKLPNKMKEIGSDCFSYSGLKSIQIPQLVKKINSKTFYHCEELNKVTLNESLIEIGESSFAYNASLKTISLPDSLEIIRSYAFNESRQLKKVKISNNTNLVELEEGSFEHTRIEELNINSKARVLFSPRNVDQLTKINFVNGPPTFFIQTEDGNIYEKTDKFGKSFEGPANIDELESELYVCLTFDFAKLMYYYCDKLNKYSLLDNREYMDKIVGYRTIEQKDINILIERNRYSPGVDKNRPLLNLVFAPKDSECLTIHEDCFSMNDYILDGMKNLTTVEYKKGITNMIGGFGQFNHLMSNRINQITEIKINGLYSHLNPGVFSNLEHLERIEISPETNISYIPRCAFENCSKLREIIIPSTCFSIEERAFKNCINLTSFLIGNSESADSKQNLRFIKKEAFFNCSSLTSITIPSSVYAICEGAFMNCTNLDNVEIVESEYETLEIIEKNSFKNCKVLSSFRLPRTCQYVGPGSFMNCISMKTFEYKGSELQSIQSRTFYNCKSLSKIEFLNLPYEDNYIPFPDYESNNKDENHNEEESKQEENNEEESKKEEHNEEETKKENSNEEENKKEEHNEEESKKEENNNEESKKDEHNEEETKKEEHNEEESKKDENNEEENKKDEHNEEEQKQEEETSKHDDQNEFKVETENQKHKKLSKSSFYIGTEAFKNCISLKSVIIEDQSKHISTIKFDTKSRPIYVYPPHIRSKIHDLTHPYCITKRQTIQKSAFSNCRSLTNVRLFLGNLECIQQNAFENCFLLNNIEINSQFWRYMFTEALDFTSFFGTPENLVIKIFNKNEYSCLMIDLMNHPKNPNNFIKQKQQQQQKSLSMNKSLPKNVLSNIKSKSFEIPKEQNQQLNKTFVGSNLIKEFLFMDTIHLYLSKTGNENVHDFILYLTNYKDRNARWDVFESIPFLFSQPLKDITEMTNLLHASNFPQFYELTSILFSDDIQFEMIPDFCFSFTSLREILIPASVEKINKYAFHSCTNLQTVLFSAGCKLKEIDENAFSKCSKLNTIDLPDQLEFIGSECFSYSGLKSIQIPQLVKKINSKTFYHCEELSKVTLNEGLVEIGESSFAYNVSLRTICLPDSLEIIGSYAFNESRQLKKVKTSNNTNLVELEEGCFEHTRIEELNVNSKARVLFSPRNVDQLTKINFVNGPPTFFIQTKDGNIYEKTDKFDELLSNVRSTKFEPYEIYQLILDDFSKEHEHIDYDSKSQEILLRRNRLRFLGEDERKPLLNLIFAPKDSRYLKIHEDCFSMNDYILDGMKNLTTIEYKKGITNMIGGFGQFNHLMSNRINQITEIKINGLYSHLNPGVFSNLEHLERIEISPETNISYIPRCAFENCSKLREIIIPSTCFSIEERAFKNCINLKSFLIRTKDKDFTQTNPLLRFIKKEAFFNCSSLTSITIPSSVYAICEGAFMNCTNLDNVEIVESEYETLEIIEKNSFKNCKVLSSFRLPRTCQYVGPGSFMNCISMKTFEYKGSELQSIQSRTFYNCKSLTIFKMKNISYTNNYTKTKTENENEPEYEEDQNESQIERQFSIGSQAFMNCTSLKKVIFEDKSKTIKTFDIGLNNSPRLLKPNHNCLKYRHNMYPRRQLIQQRAFCNCKSLIFARFFLGNLELFQTNAFKNCYLLKSIDINSQYSHFLLNEGFDKGSFEGDQDDIEFKLYNMNSYVNSYFKLREEEDIQNEVVQNGIIDVPLDTKLNIEKVPKKRHFEEHLSSFDKTKIYFSFPDENKESSTLVIHTGKRYYPQFVSSLEKTRYLFQFDLNDNKRRHRRRRRHQNKNSETISYEDLIWAATRNLPDWIDKIVILNPKSSIRLFKEYVSSFDKTYLTYTPDSNHVFIDDSIPRKRHFRHHLMTTSEIIKLEKENSSNSDNQDDSPDDLDEEEENNLVFQNNLKSKTI